MPDYRHDSQSIREFFWNIDLKEIDELRSRLRHARYPSREPVKDWSQGVPSHILEPLAKYWEEQYDVNRLVKYLNSFPQFTTTIDQVQIHFLHIKSKYENAVPLLILHGWPGSVLEFRHVVDSLANPKTSSNDSIPQPFHLVIPSLPGFVFSSAPNITGWDFKKVAKVFIELMSRLGYDDHSFGYVAQGGDFGADIVAEMGHMAPHGLRGVHMNSAFFDARKEVATTKSEGRVPDSIELKALELSEIWETDEDAYFRQQATRPQSLSFGLTDSPVGLLAWLYEKITVWSAYSTVAHGTSTDRVPPMSKDDILDNISLYWYTNSVASSLRMYWEGKIDNTALEIPEKVAVGMSLFPRDALLASKAWAERYYKRLVRFHIVGAGGHFGAWEQPELFVEEIREWMKNV